ncbi:MAG: hybrid sensor histidine kinase/response regulator [Candidatus Schekmanbacteria bacterium]|nr:hybrid sensor histidine kinase/response regulator [Candidatus Schekmanbacteria bacterium]
MVEPLAPQPPASILIVDDTPASLNLLCSIVKARGHRARPVPCGELALRAAHADPPELILLDIGMPEMDGYEVCRRLKADAALRDIPVIFVSSHAEVWDKVEAFAVGGVDYVTKPFEIEEVHARIATHLELRRRERELRESRDRLQELEALRDSLVHMLVHDLRSPLSALLAYLEILKQDAAPALTLQQRDYLEQARNAGKRMALMVTSVLDVNKLEATRMQLRISVCDAVVLAREVADSLASLVENRELAVRAAQEELFVFLDRGIIFRVLQNLVANALKFAPAAGGRVTIEVTGEQEGIRFRVTDNGPGIPAKYHSRIFEKFVQADDEWGYHAFSTGLGLAFCKLAVAAHGGRIGVESEEGAGASFWFLLPRPEQPRSQGA